MKIKKSKIINLIFFLILFFGFFDYSYAAEIKLSSPSSSYRVGDTIKANIVISSNSSVNAISANLLFDDKVSVSSLSKKSSIVNLWPIEPNFSNENKNIKLEGVILNGYTGQSGLVLTVLLKAKTLGVSTLKINDASILANDGSGTNVISGNLPVISFNIEKALDVSLDKKLKEEKDSSRIVDVAENVVEKVVQVEIYKELPANSMLLTIIVLLITIILFILCLIIIIFFRLKKYIHKKISRAEDIVSKRISILESDINSKIMVNKKENNLLVVKEEESFIKKVDETKKDIINDIDDLNEKV